MAGDSKWLPLESNPEVMTKFLRNLGLPKDWSIVDVLGLDPELLVTVPKPVAALLFLFPVNDNHEAFVSKKAAEIEKDGQVVSDKVYFMKQTVKNACGTVALVHAVANSVDLIKLGDSPLKTFLNDTAGMSPEERAKFLEQSQTFTVAHEEFALKGQTEAPSADEDVKLHFICLANVDGHLYDLDGRKPCPFNMGATSDEGFLVDASNICKQYIARDPENLQFTVLALAASSE